MVVVRDFCSSSKLSSEKTEFTMNSLWPPMREDITCLYFPPDVFQMVTKKHGYKYSLHTIHYQSLELPKRIELGDAVEHNVFHLFFYMISRFYFFDVGGDIVYYYPNKHNTYIVEKALSLLPPRFKRETEKTPGFEYIEMPGCLWYTYTMGEPWMFAYVRDLYKPLWEDIQQVKGKYSYISRNPREAKARRLLNEADLIDPLKREGFSIYTLEHMTFEEQIRLFRSSEIITGLHGAGLAWLIFCFPGTHVLELAIVGGLKQHRQHYEDLCIKCNLPYYRFTGTKFPDKERYPDCVSDDCVVDPENYINIVRRIVHLKEESSASASAI